LIKFKKKFIYLISPNKIISYIFFEYLDKIFSTRKVKFFQLRLKRTKNSEIVKIGKKIKKICIKYNVKLIINDYPKIAIKIGADGCHIGQKDINIIKARKILKNKIIGVTCHNSIKLVKIALKNKADYIALGSFYTTKTKKIKLKAKISTIKRVKKITNIPVVAIGGITSANYKKLLLNKADFLAISSFIWKNKKLNPIEAIKKIK
tara:strand:- start:101 stop:718 length:618 start_codon:yes stop_codon:yes gene_type:complete